MKNKKFLLGLFSLILIVTFSCQKGNMIYPNKAKLKKILMFSSIDSKDPIGVLAEYEYDEEDRISKVSNPRYLDGKMRGILYYDLYEYASNGQLKKIKNYHANGNSPTGFINLKNYTYTYSEDGKKEKEYIDYPQGPFEYTLYKYSNNKLVRIEKYYNGDYMESYVVNDYDNSGNLIKETSFGEDNHVLSYTQHSYENGLNTQSDVFGWRNMVHQREIFRTYDKNNNLIILESYELQSFSSRVDMVERYEYFEE